MARIVIIEDNQPVRGVMVRALQQAGHEVVETACTTQLLERLRTRRVDVLIADTSVADVEGIETVETMDCVRRVSPNTRIIAISRSGSATRRDRVAASLSALDLASQLGAVAALERPFTTSDVLAVVEQVLTMEG